MSVNIYNPTTGDLTTVADSIDSLEKVSALPSASTDLIDKVYLLTSEQTGYKKGGIYECQAIEVTPIGTEDPSEEGWYDLSGTDYVLSTDTTVDSSKTYYTIDWVLISSSGDTNIFNGTLEGWSQLSDEEKANYSHVATPEEDTEPVIPKYVNLLSRGITTTGSVSLDSGKKFSDYQAIKFEVVSREGSSSYTYVYRGAIELPIEDIQMGNSRTVIVQYNVAGNYYYMAIQITSDTTINITHVSDSLSSSYTRILRIYGEL